MHDRPDPKPAHQSAQVLKFQRRGGGSHRPPSVPATQPLDVEGDLSDDLAKYEDEDAHIDYRHRMLMNVIAVAIVTLLIGAGVWIADTIAGMEKIQDCAMQGRQNCAPIQVPAPKK